MSWITNILKVTGITAITAGVNAAMAGMSANAGARILGAEDPNEEGRVTAIGGLMVGAAEGLIGGISAIYGSNKSMSTCAKVVVSTAGVVANTVASGITGWLTVSNVLSLGAIATASALGGATVGVPLAILITCCANYCCSGASSSDEGVLLSQLEESGRTELGGTTASNSYMSQSTSSGGYGAFGQVSLSSSSSSCSSSSSTQANPRIVGDALDDQTYQRLLAAGAFGLSDTVSSSTLSTSSSSSLSESAFRSASSSSSSSAAISAFGSSATFFANASAVSVVSSSSSNYTASASDQTNVQHQSNFASTWSSISSSSLASFTS